MNCQIIPKVLASKKKKANIVINANYKYNWVPDLPPLVFVTNDDTRHGI